MADSRRRRASASSTSARRARSRTSSSDRSAAVRSARSASSRAARVRTCSLCSRRRSQQLAVVGVDDARGSASTSRPTLPSAASDRSTSDAALGRRRPRLGVVGQTALDLLEAVAAGTAPARPGRRRARRGPGAGRPARPRLASRAARAAARSRAASASARSPASRSGSSRSSSATRAASASQVDGQLVDARRQRLQLDGGLASLGLGAGQRLRRRGEPGVVGVEPALQLVAVAAGGRQGLGGRRRASAARRARSAATGRRGRRPRPGRPR